MTKDEAILLAERSVIDEALFVAEWGRDDYVVADLRWLAVYGPGAHGAELSVAHIAMPGLRDADAVCGLCGKPECICCPGSSQ